MARQTAGDRLAYGDTAIARRATTSAQAIGLADGLSAEAVAKAMWLARIYPAEARKALGPDLLNELTPSQLEIVAKLGSPLRERLLGRAVTESLSVRDLRELARREAQPSTLTTLGGVTDLASARKALERMVRPCLNSSATERASSYQILRVISTPISGSSVRSISACMCETFTRSTRGCATKAL